jgi:hypothetical protein
MGFAEREMLLVNEGISGFPHQLYSIETEGRSRQVGVW